MLTRRLLPGQRYTSGVSEAAIDRCAGTKT